jgi:hypothetical protein
MDNFTWYLVIAAVLVLPFAYIMVLADPDDYDTSVLGLGAIAFALIWPATIFLIILFYISEVIGKLAKRLARKE